jgi:outer membrane protein TolC
MDFMKMLCPEKNEIIEEKMPLAVCHKQISYYAICLLVMTCMLGCTAEKYKQDADKEVQQILDSKWKSEHGTKANARIGDVKSDPNDLYYDPNYIPSDRLSLAETVAIATARNRDYQKQKESLYISALDLTLLRHEFARKWFGTIDSNYDRTEADESTSAGGELGFTQLLADGTEISTSIATDWLRYLTGDPRESLGSVLTASVSKPLLYNKNYAKLENLTQGERTVLYQIRAFSRYRKTFVVSIVSDYYRVLQALDSVKNAESNYNSLMLAYDQAKDNALAGRLAQLEADQTEQRMLQARDTLASTERGYQQALDNFKIRLAITTNAPLQLDPNTLANLSTMEIVEPQFDVNDAIKTALSYRLDLATFKDQMDDARRKIKVSENALQAELTLAFS